MQVTAHAEINELLDNLLPRIQTVLGQKLVGVYLYGSLVWGDFDPESSDIDLVVATSSDIDDQEFSDLDQMQLAFAETYKRWQGRIEIVYVSTAALQTFKSRTSTIAVISPGEPFHFKETDPGWLMNWYMVQKQGRTLFGPAPATLIDPITRQEFIETVKLHTARWGEWVNDSHNRPSQAYAILTLCRALYTCTHGRQVSKRKAAEWAAQELPEWAPLINSALLWRANWRDDAVDHAATFPETVRFVHFMRARIQVLSSEV
jgi:predicted nucleotidyltransferase